jgi:hypothetical protein
MIQNKSARMHDQKSGGKGALPFHSLARGMAGRHVAATRGRRSALNLASQSRKGARS